MFAIHLGKILVVESADVNHTVVSFTNIACPGAAMFDFCLHCGNVLAGSFMAAAEV